MKINLQEISRHSHNPNDPNYQAIQRTLKELYQNGLMVRFNGECIAAADIIQHTLARHGVKSRIVECQLHILCHDPAMPIQWYFIGYENTNLSPNAIDTHVVVITETKVPYLIDASIGNVIGGDRPFIVESPELKNPLLIGKFNIAGMSITYTPKSRPKLLGLHAKSLLDRIQNERNILKTLTYLKLTTAVLLIVVVLNFGRGAYDFYQTYVIDHNNWGPIESQNDKTKLDDTK